VKRKSPWFDAGAFLILANITRPGPMNSGPGFLFFGEASGGDFGYYQVKTLGADKKAKRI